MGSKVHSLQEEKIIYIYMASFKQNALDLYVSIPTDQTVVKLKEGNCSPFVCSSWSELMLDSMVPASWAVLFTLNVCCFPLFR